MDMLSVGFSEESWSELSATLSHALSQPQLLCCIAAVKWPTLRQFYIVNIHPLSPAFDLFSLASKPFTHPTGIKLVLFLCHVFTILRHWLCLETPKYSTKSIASDTSTMEYLNGLASLASHGPSAILLLLALTVGTYSVCLAVHRLYISRLALCNIPGPKLAALTGWYECFYDVVLDGRYTWKIGELHDQYGPIIRISPNEVHVRDSSFMDTVYPGSSAKPVEKWPWAMTMFGSLERAEAVKTGQYRKRMPHAFFSKSAVRHRVADMQPHVDKMIDRLDTCRSTGEPVNMTWLFAGLLQDITLEMCFGESFDNMSKPDYGREQLELNMSLLRCCHLQAHFPILLQLKRYLPRSLLGKLSPSFKQAQVLQDQWLTKVGALKAKHESAGSRASAAGSNTLFEALVVNPASPASEKTIPRLLGEATSVVGAGVLTPSEIHKNLTYFILATPGVLTTLLAEIATVHSDPRTAPPLSALQSLPYFTAVLKEGLRISYGVPHRLQRVHPANDIIYTAPTHTYAIPAGTPISMTSNFSCDDEAVFPDARAFRPDRWLAADAPDFRKSTMVFGRGTRDCVGIHIAWAELYLVLGAVVWLFGRDMSLHEADRERDVEVSHDWFVSGVRKDSVGLLVKIGARE